MIGCEMAEDNFSGRTIHRDAQFNSIPRLIGGALSGSVERAMGNLMMRRVPCLAVLCGIMPDAMWTLHLLSATSLLPTRRSEDSDVL
jgi:hypothetical protein